MAEIKFSRDFEKHLSDVQKEKAKIILKSLDGENTKSAEKILLTLANEIKEFSTIGFSAL